MLVMLAVTGNEATYNFTYLIIMPAFENKYDFH